jgi:hypothetical protein
VTVNIKNKRILTIKVTNEHVHDNKALPELFNGVIKSDSMAITAIGKLFADGPMMVIIFLDIYLTRESCHA